MNNPHRREAQTEIDPASLMQPRPVAGVPTPTPRVGDRTGLRRPDETPPAPPATEADVVLAKLKEAGLPFIDSTDPAGECTLSNGDKLTLRELDGLDETYCERFMDHFEVKPNGAGQSSSLRFMALLSVHEINGQEQVPVRHIQQLERLLGYSRRDLARIVAAYIKLNLTADGATFRPQG